MRLLLATVALVCATLPRPSIASDVPTLIERLKKTGRGDAPFPRHVDIAKELHVDGPEAVRHLMPLLQDEHGGVRYVAAFALADCDGLTDEHLDALIASGRDEPQASQIPLAIANVGTPRAVDYLMAQLLSTRDPYNGNIIAAVRRLGEKAVPSLVSIYRSDRRWDADLEHRMHAVFNGAGDKAAGAIDPLLKIASDEAEPAAKRFRAIRTLAAIGPSACLQFLDSGNTTLPAAPVDNVSESYTTVELMRTIAALGARAASAGPLVAAFLDSKDWDVRVAAARALGRIGHSESAGQLVQLLKSRHDWRLVFGAAESLGMLRRDEAVSVLAEVAKTHWHPPVREAAVHATQAIQNGREKPDNDDAAVPTGRGFPDLDDVGREIETLGEEEAGKLQFAMAPAPPALRIPIKTNDGGVRTEERRGVAVEGGYLVATDHGEWGGDVAFVDKDGNSRVLTEENTQEIYATGAGIFAVSGLAHMSFNGGVIYKIQKIGEQPWTAEKWRTLPGAPRFSRLLKDGSLLVSCHGGMVLVSPDGEMRSVTKSESMRAAD